MAENKIEIKDAVTNDYLFILSHLKADDIRKVLWEHENFGYTVDFYVDLWKTFPHAFTARLNGQILFSAGIKPFEELDNNYALFWMPTIHVETYKKSYGKASYMMVDKLKSFGKAIWDMFPTWYTKNIEASKHLGFIPQKTVNIKGQDFIVSKLEV